ncbi:hypothetical protein [Martelella sp.]|uniref:hypothetical protein n=1 Tax=Martelella sp. TaxID=1969699 RepID=UPI0025C44CBD|nr:hypothetical protein [Martelella sp.]
MERLLNGEFRPDDLTGLFLYARDHCDGRETVAEIGHFVAHHNERDKGITTRCTREWFASTRYLVPAFFEDGSGGLDASRLPSTAVEYFRIAVNRVGPATIKKGTGLKPGQANKILQDVIGRMSQNGDSTWRLPNDLKEIETSLLNCVSSTFVSKSAFEEERLVEEFIATLKSNGLVTNDEVREKRATLATLIPLYAVSAMHNCLVQIGDGTTTQLKGSASLDGIQVSASVPLAAKDGGDIFLVSPMFRTGLSPNQHCSDELVLTTWDFEIELGPDKRLSRLG